MRHIRPFDGVRAIAILLVMAYHLNLFGLGRLGVELFFVLSGYLITESLVSRLEKPSFLSFYGKRARRILPLYYLLLFIYFILSFVLFDTTLRGYLPSLALHYFNFTSLAPDYEYSKLYGHFWSLSMEVQFYVLWPILLLTLPRRMLTRALGLIIILSPILRFGIGILLEQKGMTQREIIHAIHNFTPVRLDAFALGALAHLKREELSGFALKALRLLALAILVTYGFLVINSLQFPAEAGLNWYHHFMYIGYSTTRWLVIDPRIIYSVAYLPVHALGALLLIVISTNSQNEFSRFLSLRGLTAVGKISYSLYVLHHPLQWLFYDVWFPTAMYFRDQASFFVLITYLATTFTLSFLTFNGIEKKFMTPTHVP